MKHHPSRQEKILVIKTQAIGDVLLTTPSIRALRLKNPQAHITAMVGDWSKDALIGNPHLDEVIPYKDAYLLKFHIGKILRLVSHLRKKHFDKIFMFHPSVYIHLLGFLAGSAQRFGFVREHSGFSLTKKIPWPENGYPEYVAQTYLKLVGDKARLQDTDLQLDFFIPEKDRAYVEGLVAGAGISPQEPFVAIAPGGGKNPRDTVYAKRWDVKKFARLSDAIQAQYGLKTVLLGSIDDRPVTDELLRLASTRPIDFCCKTSLKQLGAVIEKASLLITNDSAPLHLGVALSRPTVSLFGPSDPELLLPRDRKHVAIKSRKNCSPCYTNNLFPGCNNPRCMDDITLEEVLDAVVKQLEKEVFSRTRSSS